MIYVKEIHLYGKILLEKIFFFQGFKCKKLVSCHRKKLRTIKYQSKTAGILIKCSPISSTTLIRVTAIFDEILRVLNFFLLSELVVFGHFWPMFDPNMAPK